MVQEASVSLFCCLQYDSDADGEEGDGGVYLKPEYVRREFPRLFTRYESLSQEPKKPHQQLEFIHEPIEDLNVPSDGNRCYRSSIDC